MTNQPNDGGPAFPSDRFGDRGMSLRDWFAGQALENDIINHFAVLQHKNNYKTQPTREECRYSYADAMLKARGIDD